ncbi:winged helix-turn-helix domain-containing protein [Crenobacter intestini]|uniref:OmpR/PhoB-type domain-containing protein n=1 Tax=Crenobacter intestini TaxID=2563443 RepID=A0A4T0UWK7_9NEIS|nr:winged helix-turn-helix domain-containing protein [Crenobacter intestini]TIC83470.1 hypothetical protein E5K04_07895 [Crenobacter intestini]
MTGPDIRIGDWTFLPPLGQLRDERRGRAVTLTPRAARLLACLAAQPDVVLGQAELAAACGVDPAGHALTQAVSELRQALRDGREDAPCYIQTIPKRGYRLSVLADVGMPGAVAVQHLGARWLLFGVLSACFIAVLAMLWPLHMANASAPRSLALPNARRIAVVFELVADERLETRLVGLGAFAAHTIATYTPYEVVQMPNRGRASARPNSGRRLVLRVVEVGRQPYLHARLSHRLREQVLLDKHYPLQLQAATMTALSADLLCALHQPLPARLPGADALDDLSATEQFFSGHYYLYRADAASLREAVNLLETVRERYPTRPEVLAMLAISLLALSDLAGGEQAEAGGETVQWRARADAAMSTLVGLSASPYFSHPLIGEAQALYSLSRGRPRQGQEMIEKVLRTRETWRAQVIHGKLHEISGELDLAADAYARAWLLRPEPTTLAWIRQLAFATDLAAIAPGLDVPSARGA